MSISSPLDLIADPVRLAVLRRLTERGPASLADLAAAAGVHANTVRPHLSVLEAAGALTRTTKEPAGRGRPANRYALAEDWRLPGTDLHALAELLAALILRLAPDDREVESFGRDWGRFLLGRPGEHDVRRDMTPTLERLGFQARIEGNEVLLSACPCPLVSPQRPRLLCALAIAVIDGLAEAAGSPLRVRAARHDPRQRVCSATMGPARRRSGRSHASGPRTPTDAR